MKAGANSVQKVNIGSNSIYIYTDMFFFLAGIDVHDDMSIPSMHMSI